MIKEDNSITVLELANKLNVSDKTIKRDIVQKDLEWYLSKLPDMQVSLLNE